MLLGAAELSMRDQYVPCAALVPGDYAPNVVFRISICFQRPCALKVICGARQVPRRSIYIYIYMYFYIYIYMYVHIYIYITYREREKETERKRDR